MSTKRQTRAQKEFIFLTMLSLTIKYLKKYYFFIICVCNIFLFKCFKVK